VSEEGEVRATVDGDGALRGVGSHEAFELPIGRFGEVHEIL
jgi:hypothetical protein